MSKLSLAAKLADETGVALTKAKKFVDDVGTKTASRSLDEMTQAGSRTISDWWKPALATGGLVGGGALVWRQQDLQEAEAIASQQQGYSDAWQALMDSGLSPEAKKELAVRLIEQSPASNDNSGSGGGGGDSSDDGGLLPDDPATIVILVIVLVMVLRYSLGGSG